MEHPVHRFIDLTAAGATIAALLELAPKLAGLAALIWWSIRIYKELRRK
jgi:hypothetical protein